MKIDKLTWVTGLGGLALLGLGIGMGIRQRRALGGLGRGKLKEPPMIGAYSDGNMRTTLHDSPTMPIEARVAQIQKLIHASIQDPEMRRLALSITRGCPERDKICEARAIYHYVKQNVRYTGDVGAIQHPDGIVEGVDLYQSARRTLIDMKGGDCLPAGTLLLVEGHRFVPIEEVLVGARIWGRDTWTVVKDVWAKGTLPVDMVHLNNGSSFMATGEHKVYAAICNEHPFSHRRENSAPCSCGMDKRSVERITIAQLEPGMVLVQPERIAFGREAMDPRRAYVEGLYASDGWKSHECDFDIAGRDGHPKEAQKREVAEICAALGVETTWFKKSIRVRDREWAMRVEKMGDRARFKHALSIDLDEASASELLRGIMADSGKNTNGGGRTFTTTSRELMLQTRVLHRMFGHSCSERFIVDHGGEGEHPIHRLGVRDVVGSGGHRVKLLRVKEIDRSVGERRVFDISTEDHYVYLPEADVVVSNCDDQSIAVSTLLALNGIDPTLRIVKEFGAEDWQHIFPGFFVGRKFIAVDTTLPGDQSFGVEPRYFRKVDFPA